MDNTCWRRFTCMLWTALLLQHSTAYRIRGQPSMLAHLKETCEKSLHDFPNCTCTTVEERQYSSCATGLKGAGISRTDVKAIVKSRGNTSRHYLGNGWRLQLSEAQITDADRLYRTIHWALDGMPDEWYRGRLCRDYTRESLAIESFFRQEHRHSLFMLELSNRKRKRNSSIPSAIPVAIGGLQELPAKQLEEKGYENLAGLRVAEVVTMYTDQGCQGFGLAGWVMEEIFARAKRWGVNHLVLKASHMAKGVYARYGFEKIREPGIRYDDKGNKHLGGVPMEKDLQI